MRPLPVVAVLLVVALAGCLGGDDKEEPRTGWTGRVEDGNGTAAGDPSRPSVEGFVLNAQNDPLVGAKVVVQNEAKEAIANATGHYGFAGLMDNEVYRLIATHDGYDTKTLQVVVVQDKIVRLDFRLEATPVEEPYHEIIERAGFVSCQYMAGAGNDHGGGGVSAHEECGAGLVNDPNAADIIEVELSAGVVAVVIEVGWDSVTPLADFMAMTAETSGYGDLDTEFGEVIGPSVLRIDLNQDLVKKYYNGNGGLLRVAIESHVEDDDEQAAGAAFAFQQPFELRVSEFFVEPNPAGYSAFEAGA